MAKGNELSRVWRTAEIVNGGGDVGEVKAEEGTGAQEDVGVQHHEEDEDAEDDEPDHDRGEELKQQDKGEANDHADESAAEDDEAQRGVQVLEDLLQHVRVCAHSQPERQGQLWRVGNGSLRLWVRTGHEHLHQNVVASGGDLFDLHRHVQLSRAVALAQARRRLARWARADTLRSRVAAAADSPSR